MIKKPNVLSDEEIVRCILGGDISDYMMEHVLKDLVGKNERTIAQAQLDADAEYYEPLIKEMYEALEWVMEDMETDEGTRIKASTQTAVWRALIKAKENESPDLEFNHEIHDKNG